MGHTTITRLFQGGREGGKEGKRVGRKEKEGRGRKGGRGGEGGRDSSERGFLPYVASLLQYIPFIHCSALKSL